MTKYFEILRRDGPARMGKLLLNRQISTPGVITPDDYLSAGSVYSYESLDEAIAIQEGLKGQKKLAILPYVPSALHSEPALELPAMDLDGPSTPSRPWSCPQWIWTAPKDCSSTPSERRRRRGPMFI